jgi:PST family polysaccharide transporter
MIQQILKRKAFVLNTAHVFVNKGLNAIVPVLLIPYFNKIFGVAVYGELIYIQSLMMVLMFVTDYGFSTTGTRDISIHKSRNDEVKLAESLNAILITKMMLSLVCYAVLMVFIRVMGFSLEVALLYILTFTAFVLQSFTPFWYFQGIKSNSIITLINLFSKLVLLLLVFNIVKEGAPLLTIPIVEAISYAISFVSGVFVIFYMHKIKFRWPDKGQVWQQLKSGRYLFMFSIFNWLITGGSIVAVEFFLTATELGYYGTFSRLTYYCFALVQPINQALFPYISGKINHPIIERFYYVNLALKVYGAAVIIFLICSMLMTTSFFDLFFDSNFNANLFPFLPTFYLMCFWISLVMITYFLGIQVLVAFKQDKVYSRYYFVNTGIAMLGFVFLTPWLGLPGVALSLILGELSLLVLLWLAYRRLRQIKN